MIKRTKSATLYKVALRETKSLFKQPLSLFCAIIAPIFCFILFAMLMYRGLPTELPTAIVDADNSGTIRSITRYLASMQQIDITARYANIEKATKAMRRGEIYAFYLFPQGTTDAIYSQMNPRVSFYMNYDYLAAGSLTYKDMYINSLLANADIGRKQLLAQGATNLQTDNFLQPIVVDTHAIGNPWLSYSIYLNNTLFPGLLSLLIFQLTAYSITLEIKSGTAKRWLKQSRNDIVIAVTGKLLPQTIIYSLVAVLYNVILYRTLHFPSHDGIINMIAASFLLVVASQGLGITLAALLPSPRWAVSIASLWGVVSFSISGFSFPIEGMSGAIQTITNLFPLRHYFVIYCNNALLGNAANYVALHYAALLIFALLPLPLLPRLKKALTTYPYIE